VPCAQDVNTVSGAPPASLPSAHRAEEARKPLIAGYDLLRTIGSGGMGVVWEAIEHHF